MLGNSPDFVEKRKVFRKELKNYKLDHNNRLLIINPLNNDEEKELEYKIHYLHEKDILVMQAYYEHNNRGKINVINIMHQDKWYWYGMNSDIGNIIKSCKYCNKPLKFKALFKKLKNFR